MSVSRPYAAEVELPAEAFRHQQWSAAEVSSDLRLLWLVDQVRQRRLGYAKAAEVRAASWIRVVTPTRRDGGGRELVRLHVHEALTITN